MRNRDFLPVLGLGLCLAIASRLSGGPAGGSDRVAVWKSIGPDGGVVTKLVLDPAVPAGVYALSSGAPYRVFRSTNAGVSWKRAILLPEGFCDLVLAPEDPDTIYGIGLDTFYKSLNKGASWTRCGLGKYINRLIIVLTLFG